MQPEWSRVLPQHPREHWNILCCLVLCCAAFCLVVHCLALSCAFCHVCGVLLFLFCVSCIFVVISFSFMFGCSAFPCFFQRVVILCPSRFCSSLMLQFHSSSSFIFLCFFFVHFGFVSVLVVCFHSDSSLSFLCLSRLLLVLALLFADRFRFFCIFPCFFLFLFIVPCLFRSLPCF